MDIINHLVVYNFFVSCDIFACSAFYVSDTIINLLNLHRHWTLPFVTRFAGIEVRMRREQKIFIIYYTL